MCSSHFNETSWKLQIDWLKRRRPSSCGNLCYWCPFSLADLGGAWGTHAPPLGVQILSISCSFRENLACPAPPGGFTPPLGKILDPPLLFFLIWLSLRKLRSFSVQCERSVHDAASVCFPLLSPRQNRGSTCDPCFDDVNTFSEPLVFCLWASRQNSFSIQ